MRKRKVYNFSQLPKGAKKRAADLVSQKEMNIEQDWSFECENITDSIAQDILETGLQCGDIYWEDYYGVNINFGSVKMDDEFLKKTWTEAQFNLFDELNNVCGGYIEHDLNKNLEYKLIFDYGGFDHQEAMEFILKYSEDEATKVKFKFPHLLEEELNDELYSELQIEMDRLGEKITKELASIIKEKLDELRRNLIKMVREAVDYMGSEEYYYEALDAEVYPFDIYLFNYQGDIVMRDNEYVECEYEEIYDDAAA